MNTSPFPRLRFIAGDVVQLRSGGAPLTVGAVVSRDRIDPRGDMLRLVTISAGGLLQETTAQSRAVVPYQGPRIASFKREYL